MQPVTITVDHRYAEAVRASLEIDGLAPIPLELSLGKQAARDRAAGGPGRCAASGSPEGRRSRGGAGQVVRHPVRPWTIYLLPHSHNDIGYTTLQPDVERKQINNLKTAMRLARDTAGYPEGARFKWNVEVMWPVDCYLPPGDRRGAQSALLDAVRAGQVRLEGLYGEHAHRAFPARGADAHDGLRRRSGPGVRRAAGIGHDQRRARLHLGHRRRHGARGVKYFSFGPNWFGRMGYTMGKFSITP